MGEVPERLNGTVSKIVVGATPPRVRIPASPPFPELSTIDYFLTDLPYIRVNSKRYSFFSRLPEFFNGGYASIMKRPLP
jgi:hypothetical protein